MKYVRCVFDNQTIQYNSQCPYISYRCDLVSVVYVEINPLPTMPNFSMTINFNKKWPFYYYPFLLTILNLTPFYCAILVLMYRYLIRISLCLSHALKNPAK